MNDNAVVIFRSVINQNNYGQQRNNRFSFFRPTRSVIERNGKQFLTEFRQRTEQRYVRIFDEPTGRMRLFEVLDYIPSKVVRPISHNFQSQRSNQSTQNLFVSALKSDQHPVTAPIPSNWSQPSTPKSSDSAENFRTRESINSLPNVHRNSINDTSANSFEKPPGFPHQPYHPSNAGSTAPTIIDQPETSSKYSSSAAFVAPSLGPQNIFNQYSSGTLGQKPSHIREHTPTASDYSVSVSDSDTNTETDDYESVGQPARFNKTDSSYNQANPSTYNDRNNIKISQDTDRNYAPSVYVNPFDRTNITGDHHYRVRSRGNRYAEPTLQSGKFSQATGRDYAPIQYGLSRTEGSQYSHLQNSNPSLYNS